MYLHGEEMYSCPLISSLPRSRFLDVAQRSPLFGGALRDIQKNACEGDYLICSIAITTLMSFWSGFTGFNNLGVKR